MHGGDGSGATQIGDVEEGEDVEVGTIFTEVCEKCYLQPDEYIFHRALGDFIADFEPLAEATDMSVPLG